MVILSYLFFFFSSRRRHTRYWRDWSSDVCSSDLWGGENGTAFWTNRINGGTGFIPNSTYFGDDSLSRCWLNGGLVPLPDRKRGVEGKRGDLGGRRIIKKKKK